jgi:serine phosphatase RsbU (regulator of sigma subunit)
VDKKPKPSSNNLRNSARTGTGRRSSKPASASKSTRTSAIGQRKSKTTGKLKAGKTRVTREATAEAGKVNTAKTRKNTTESKLTPVKAGRSGSTTGINKAVRGAGGERAASNARKDQHRIGGRGLGIAAKFSIPVCILFFLVISAWGIAVSKNMDKTLRNDVKKSGVTALGILDRLGASMLKARKEMPGGWPIAIGLVSKREIAKEFGSDLEKKVISLGYKNISEAYNQLDNFKRSDRINRKNKFKIASDLARGLGFSSVETAKNELNNTTVGADEKSINEIISRLGKNNLLTTYKLLDKAAFDKNVAVANNHAKTLGFKSYQDAQKVLDLVIIELESKDSSSDKEDIKLLKRRGLAEAHIRYFDTPSIAKKINKYVMNKAMLKSLLKLEFEDVGLKQNDILDVLISFPDPRKPSESVLLARSNKMDGGKIQFTTTPNEGGIDFGAGTHKLKDIEIEEGTMDDGGSKRAAMTFNKPILSAGGARLGTAYLALSSEKIDKELRKIQVVMVLIGIGAIFVAAGICIVIARMVAQPAHTLVKDMNIVAQGDLTHRTIARSSDEIGLLAEQFNQMTHDLLSAQAAEKEAQRIEDELQMARDIQMELLPKKIPHVKGLDIDACYFPAKEVGGDYYDFLGIDREHLGIMVADVSGKGIPGSMVMGTTRTILRFTAAGNNSAADTLARTNRVVAADIRRGMFVTAFYLVLNVRTGEMLAASAGHNPMVVYRAATNSVELINPNGIALGFDKGVLFERTVKQQTVKLNRGDRVVLYTDGVVESMNSNNEEYTDERLYEFSKTHKDLGSKEFIAELLKDIRKHQGSAEQHDDITIVSFRAQ